jgi:hypothetical protein
MQTREGEIKGRDARLRSKSETYSKGALEGDVVARDGLDSLVGDDGLAVLVQAGGDIDGLPLDGDVCGVEDVLDRLGDLGTDTVTLDERDGELAIVTLSTLELCDSIARSDGVGASKGNSGELLLSGLTQALAGRGDQ